MSVNGVLEDITLVSLVPPLKNSTQSPSNWWHTPFHNLAHLPQKGRKYKIYFSTDSLMDCDLGGQACPLHQSFLVIWQQWVFIAHKRLATLTLATPDEPEGFNNILNFTFHWLFMIQSVWHFIQSPTLNFDASLDARWPVQKWFISQAFWDLRNLKQAMGCVWDSPAISLAFYPNCCQAPTQQSAHPTVWPQSILRLINSPITHFSRPLCPAACKWTSLVF